MASRPHRVPSFSLYGDPSAAGPPHVHVEEIATRSHRYRWHIGAHAHPALHQCVYVSEGPVEVELDGQRPRLVAPVLIVLPPGTVHAFRFEPGTRGYVVSVDGPSTLADADPLVRAHFARAFGAPSVVPLPAGGSTGQRLRTLCELLLAEFRQARGDTPPTCLWIARTLLWLAAGECAGSRPLASVPRAPSRHYERLRQLVEQNYLRHWPVTRYARLLGLAPARLNRLCQAEAGCSVGALLAQRLALEARRRLAHLALPVASVAIELGFRDPAYFARFFRRHEGCTPLAFRRRHLRPASG